MGTFTNTEQFKPVSVQPAVSRGGGSRELRLRGKVTGTASYATVGDQALDGGACDCLWRDPGATKKVTKDSKWVSELRVRMPFGVSSVSWFLPRQSRCGDQPTIRISSDLPGCPARSSRPIFNTLREPTELATECYRFVSWQRLSAAGSGRRGRRGG